MELKEIDLDIERINAPLSYREKIMIKILFAIFTIVTPAKYKHQVRDLIKNLFDKD